MLNLNFIYNSGILPNDRKGIPAVLNYLDIVDGKIKPITGTVAYGSYTAGFNPVKGFTSKSFGISEGQEGILLQYFENSNNGGWHWFLPDNLEDVRDVFVFAFTCHGSDIDSYVRSLNYGFVVKIDTSSYGEKHPLNLISEAVQVNPYRPSFNLFGDYLALLLLSLLVEHKDALSHPFIEGDTLGSALRRIASRKHPSLVDAMMRGDIIIDPAQLFRGSKYLGRELYPQYYLA